MMARYIDADKFAERIKTSPAFNKIGFEGELLQEVVLDLLNNMLAADVEEVKHGEWIVVGRTEHGKSILKCSRCERVRKNHGRSSFCCDCGAKMDGRGDT